MSPVTYSTARGADRSTLSSEIANASALDTASFARTRQPPLDPAVLQLAAVDQSESSAAGVVVAVHVEVEVSVVSRERPRRRTIWTRSWKRS